MDWGRSFSREIYLSIFDQMMNGYMYWGGEFDQQQKYVDVQGIYLGLKDGSMTRGDAQAALIGIRDTQLLPWYEADLGIQAWAWTNGANILDAALP